MVNMVTARLRIGKLSFGAPVIVDPQTRQSVLGKAAMGLRFCNIVFAVLLFVTGVAPCVAQDDPVDRGLIAHWKFAEGVGDVVKDSSGEGNDGKIVPADTSEPKWGTGYFAGSVSFNGDNDHFVRIPPSASLNTLKKQITIVALIYPKTLWTRGSTLQRGWEKAVRVTKNLLGIAHGSFSTGFIAIVQRQWRETMHPDQYFLGYGPENNVLQYKWHLGLMGGDQVSLYRLPQGQDKPRVGAWVQLAGTYNGETGKMSLYVDGEQIATQTHFGEIRLDPESLNRPVTIGAELNGTSIDDPSGEFVGYVRDVRIYDRALSDQEIKTLAAEVTRHVTQ